MAVVLREAADGRVLMFFCPGCECGHQVHVNPARNSVTNATWEWNGSMDKPTFRPSILCSGWKSETEGIKDSPRCHSFVTDGNIQFLDDCTHKLAGQTVPLPDWNAA